MHKSKVIFALPATINGGFLAGTRRRSLIVAKTLQSWGYDVDIQIGVELSPVTSRDTVYIFEMHHLKQCWGRLRTIPGFRYVVDIPESIITAQRDYIKYASWPRRLRYLTARAYYSLRPPDPLYVTVEILTEASAIICASPLQCEEFGALNANVTWIWDAILADEYKLCRTRWDDDIPTLVWEGGGNTLFQLEEAAEAICAVQLKRKLKVLVVSDPFMNTHDGRCRKTVDFLEKLKIQAQFIEWNINSFAEELTKGCIGIAPLAWRNRFYWQKGANKVQVMNALGLPVIASHVPAYRDWLTFAGSGLLASNCDEWGNAIDFFCSHPEARREMGLRGAKGAWQACSPEAIAKRWLTVLEAL